MEATGALTPLGCHGQGSFLGGYDAGVMSTQTAQNVEAVGTVLAALFAGIAALFAYRAYRKERESLVRVRTREKQAQASRVAAWVGSNGKVTTHNDTATPIYRVELKFFYDGQELGKTPERVVVPPSKTNTPRQPPPGLLNSFTAINTSGDYELIEVETWFTDASGHAWVRRRDGALETQPWGRGRPVPSPA